MAYRVTNADNNAGRMFDILATFADLRYEPKKLTGSLLNRKRATNESAIEKARSAQNILTVTDGEKYLAFGSQDEITEIQPAEHAAEIAARLAQTKPTFSWALLSLCVFEPLIFIFISV